jgi:tRNA1Val (adenine37-N6)-methyltransferase
MPFRFKNFTVDDEGCTMKVGTDAVLLGAWARTGNAANILDVGTGCGVIALMMAQKSNASIDAVETDGPSVMAASVNFSGSPWAARLRIIHDSFQSFSQQPGLSYDLVVSNPPFFTGHLLSPNPSRNTIRHTLQLSHDELLAGVTLILNEAGKLAIILPHREARAFRERGAISRLFLLRQCDVISRDGRDPVRSMLELGKQRCVKPLYETLVMRDSNGAYTADYLGLIRDFYLFA